MEAAGGFEPPNKGFADPRLEPLGYVAANIYLFGKYRFCRPLPNRAVRSAQQTNLMSNKNIWCRGRDSNPHVLTNTTPST